MAGFVVQGHIYDPIIVSFSADLKCYWSQYCSRYWLFLFAHLMLMFEAVTHKDCCLVIWIQLHELISSKSPDAS